MYTSYKHMLYEIINRNNFKGNSTEAINDKDEGYIIWSYSTRILVIKDNSIYFDNRMYSVTTSKLQNIIKRALNLTDCKDRAIYNLEIK